VCLIDLKLPDMDGTELLKIPTDHETIKIIVTGFSTEEVGKQVAHVERLAAALEREAAPGEQHQRVSGPSCSAPAKLAR